MNLQGLKPLLFLVLGAALGMAFFGALAWNVRLYCGNSGTRLAPLIHAIRLLGMAAVFVGIAELGAAPLLSALAGFHLARVFAIRAKGLAFETVP
jgi:F1F0 ATPase subunit 2